MRDLKSLICIIRTSKHGKSTDDNGVHKCI